MAKQDQISQVLLCLGLLNIESALSIFVLISKDQVNSRQINLYYGLLINLLVYNTYTENLVCVILVTFLFSYSLYWISPRPNTADLALIRLTSYLYGLTCDLYGNTYI